MKKVLVKLLVILFSSFIFLGCKYDKLIITNERGWWVKLTARDKILYVLKGDYDPYPECDSRFNKLDSISKLDYWKVDSIHPEFIQVCNYHIVDRDTISKYKRALLKKTDREIFKKNWKWPTNWIIVDDSLYYIFDRYDINELVKLEYDSLEVIISMEYTTECQSQFTAYWRTFWESNKKLRRSNLDNYEVIIYPNK